MGKIKLFNSKGEEFKYNLSNYKNQNVYNGSKKLTDKKYWGIYDYIEDEFYFSNPKTAYKHFSKHLKYKNSKLEENFYKVYEEAKAKAIKCRKNLSKLYDTNIRDHRNFISMADDHFVFMFEYNNNYSGMEYISDDLKFMMSNNQISVMKDSYIFCY